jgi:nitrate reductase gamma subunit
MTPYVFTYICVAAFIAAVVFKVHKQLRLSFHLRWELYPVRHETGKKAEYGGSYMEETDWWKKKRKRSLVNELSFMIPEIFLLRGLRVENARLWNVSFPFHLGLYLMGATLILLLLGAGGLLFGSEIAPGRGMPAAFFYYAPILTCGAGLFSGVAGSASLSSRRLKDPGLRTYSSFSDYFNLVLFFLFFHISLLAWLFYDPALHHARAYVYGLLTFGSLPQGYTPAHSLLTAAAVIFASFILAYIPFTHMSHMFMKYFLYHKMRWDDAPNVRGGSMETEILASLGLKPTWSARHIKADGSKTWADLASTPSKEEK